MRSFFVALAFVLLFVPLSVSAQSNEIIDDILAEEEMTYGSAAYLLLFAVGELDDGADRITAVTEFQRLDDSLRSAGEAARFRPVGHILNYAPDTPITLGEYALLVMRSFGIPGGMIYSLVPSPRYASRELVFRRAIQGNAFPRMNISGERGMRILGRILALQEEGVL